MMQNFYASPRYSGLEPSLSDSDKYSLPQQCLLPLTVEDKRKTEAMLLRCYLQNEAPPQWRLELQLMLERGVKFELEALSVHELNYLSEVYIPSKLQGGVHISHHLNLYYLDCRINEIIGFLQSIINICICKPLLSGQTMI